MLFPVYFACLWLFVTTLLGMISGWFILAARYPDQKGAPLITLRGQSGAMGLFVGTSRILKISASETGVRVSINRLFGPFCQPFFVPWGEISAARSSFFFLPMIKLRFAKTGLCCVWLYPGTWRRLVEATSQAQRPEYAAAMFTNQELLKGLALYWLALTLLAGSFFYYSSNSVFASGGSEGVAGLPPAMCFGFPATVFGVGAIYLYLTQRRP